MMNFRSHMVILIFLCRSSIICSSKKQNTVDSSTFGSENVAMQTGTELTKSLKYKLRMMVLLIDKPTSVFCDNKSVVTSISFPTSTLENKHLVIFYHAVREAVSVGIHQIFHIAGDFNPWMY